MLFCPKCAVPMERKAEGTLTVDGCPQCGGLLLARAAWDRLGDDLEAAMALEHAFTDNTPIPVLSLEMACPQCGMTMESVRPPEVPNMEFEMCLQCGGLWLDDGELGKVVQALRSRRRMAPFPAQDATDKAASPLPAEWVYCAQCGRENFPDADECWACGKPLVPEPPTLPIPLQRLAELLSMAVGGTGAVLFGMFVARPNGEKWAGLGLALLLTGLLGLAALRRIWRRGKGAPFFPTYSGH